jgi:hypothetical protein
MLDGSWSTGGSKRYCGSYAFTNEPLLPGGTSLILSAAFDDLESLSELYAAADSVVMAPDR